LIAYYPPEWESLASRIVGRWCPSFSGNTGLQLPDTMGRNHGVPTNFANNGNDAYVTSPEKVALSFNGLNNRVRCGLIREFPGNSFTASAWIRALPSPPAANGNMVLSNLNAPLSQGLHFINLTSSGQLNVAGATGGGATGITIGPDLRDGTWHHVCTGRNGAITGTNGFVYLDGKLLGTGNFGTLQIPSNEQLQIGQRADNGFNQVFFGEIDDVILFSSPFSAAEVRFLYDQGRGGGLLREPPKRRSFFVPTLPTPFPVRRRSSRFLAFPG
jgi:hypothetical protein